MKRYLSIFLLLIIFASACSEQNETSEEPTPAPTLEISDPLPTAVQPDSTSSGGGWAVTFRYDFPDSYWHLGDHSYGFLIDCPDLDYDFSTEWLIFSVSDEIDPIGIPAFLRLNGLSLEPYAPAYMDERVIHPDQDTAAVVHIVGLSEEEAKNTQEECEVLIAWDQSSPKVLEPVDVFKP